MYTTSTPPAATYALCDGVVTSAVGQELLLLSLESGVYYSLNAVGTSIWEHVTQGRSVADIIAAIVIEFDVTAYVAARDLRRFLDDLSGMGLLVAR